MGLFRMPSLGADMEAGTLAEWLVNPGDTVDRGDIVAVVETQKGAIEIEVFEAGPVTELLIEEGDEVPVGTPIARIGEAAEEAGADTGETPPSSEKAAPPSPPPPTPRDNAATQSAPTGDVDGRPKASPAARRLAEERGIDLTTITGTGPGRGIVLADVEGATTAEPRPKQAKTAQRPAGGLDLAEMRRAIAAAMARSKREIPHYYVAHQIDAERLFAWLDAHNADCPPEERLIYAAPLVKAVALATADFPEMSGFFGADGFEPRAPTNVGVATAIRGGGLIAPAIHHVAALPLPDVMARMRDLIARIRRGGLRSSEMAEATITLTSLGERGADQLWGVIVPPQVAIVGMGSPRTRAWAMDDGTLAARRIIAASLAADHRVSDGHRGALFLAKIDSLLQEPQEL
jgi:pyruvate dehydrogenase E2 component (dihydrolipoamide acetyltransferase)